MSNLPARILELLSLLQSRREWSGGELAERLGVTGRTIRRDIDRLRELGYPVAGTTGTAGGYRLAPGRHLPPLLLSDEEAVATATALLAAAAGQGAGGTLESVADSAVQALAKLEQVLPARLRAQVTAINEMTTIKSGGGARVDPRVLAVLATACRDGEEIWFDYVRRDGSQTSRAIEPHHLVAGYGRWYLLAYEPAIGDWRTFRIDRISDPRPTRRRFRPRPVPSTSPAAQLGGAIVAASYRYEVTATVRAPAETVTARLPWIIPIRIQPMDDDSCEIRLGADSIERVAANLLALNAPFTLDAPPEVLTALRALSTHLTTAVTAPNC